MSAEPKISVIILNWNGSDLMRRYLPSVLQYSPAPMAEVIVADNGSTDDSLQVLSREFPAVRVLSFPDNLGFAGGYNQAIAEVRTPYVVLLNSDVAVTEGWLQPLLAFAEAHPEVAALQPKLLSDRQQTHFEYAGAAGGYLDALGYPFCRGRLFDVVEEDRGQYDTVRPVQWATGACLFVRTELYRLVGGLDELFFAHMEEIDLCWRLRRAGYDLYCVPSSRVYHLGGASLAMGHPRKTYLNFRNSLLMLYKNLPRRRRQRTLFLRCLLDGVAALRFLLAGETPHVRAIWFAHRDARRMMRTAYARYRDPFPSPAAPPRTFPEQKVSILWQYYIRRRRTYAEIFR
jgi:GT2 family glycosyltransferase